MPLPTSGTYSLEIATLTTSTTKPQTQGPYNVTFITGGYIINGKKYIYSQVWGVEGSDKVIFKLSDGSYMLLADPNGNMSNVTIKYVSTTSPTTWVFSYNSQLLGESTLYQGNGNFVPHYEGAAPCFLAGTEILAGDRVVAVEDIRVGDEVDIFGHQTVRSRKVVWAGKSRMTAMPGRKAAQAGYPVCISRGAFAEDVPYRDMRVTAEHSFFFEGKLFPVRMLVNDRTIYYDRDCASYDYYHIELEEHSVIMADGALTESYLNTGHTTFPHKADARLDSWSDNAAFPLDTSREFVEAIFRRIEKRAETLGVALRGSEAGSTDERPTCVETSCGTIVMPLRRSGDRLIFQIPDSATEITLRSDSARPCDAIGPFVDDRRQLGLLVGELELYYSDSTRRVDLTTVASSLGGWYAGDAPETRWTNGAGQVLLPERSGSGTALLSVQILATGKNPG